jgi:hypothetical protein
MEMLRWEGDHNACARRSLAWVNRINTRRIFVEYWKWTILLERMASNWPNPPSPGFATAGAISHAWSGPPWATNRVLGLRFSRRSAFEYWAFWIFFKLATLWQRKNTFPRHLCAAALENREICRFGVSDLGSNLQNSVIAVLKAQREAFVKKIFRKIFTTFWKFSPPFQMRENDVIYCNNR